MRFFGHYIQKCDAKHRVVVPQKLRNIIGEEGLRAGLFITRGPDKCLYMFTASQWEVAAKEVEGRVLANRKARSVQMVFFNEAVQVDVDDMGRILLPDSLREIAGIEDEVLFAGTSNRIELWRPDRWRACRDASVAQYEELIESLCVPPPREGAD